MIKSPADRFLIGRAFLVADITPVIETTIFH